ncbi:ABC transporter permease [Amphibacillus jilinensis]|uniref:ABC transporter permease n=1 Tax=Amphibacillus jilinensis TaxID=1216008 RepID=UPI0002EE8F9D|nr:hypothetical protein [Amphibacillus jilinensis]
MANQPNYQTGLIFRFLFKREVVKLLVWIVPIVAMTVTIALAFNGLYETQEERQALAETMENPAMKALVGQGYGLDNYTDGAMLAHQMLLMTAVVVAIMSMLLIVRLTRADEEDGQLEMLRALPMGRLAQTNAALFVLVITNIVLMLITAISLTALGMDSIDWAGSLLYGSVLGTTGLFFGAITLLAAQLSDNTRGTMMLGYLVLGLSYMIRSIGDSGNELLSWFSPLGILLGSEVYVNNYWWPILVIVLLAIIIIALALYLQQIRDVGAGLLPQRSGRKAASPMLQSQIGLALRLLRTSLIAWIIGMMLIGISYGSVLGDLEAFLGESEAIMEIIGASGDMSITEQFISVLLKIMAIFSTIPALVVFVRLKSEEKKGRLEHLLAKPVSRKKILGTYLGLSFLTSIVMMLAGIIALAGIGVTVMDVDISFNTLVEAQLVYLPAVWILIGFAAALYGWCYKWSRFIWLYLLFSFLTVYLGDLLDLPAFILGLSPYYHIPELPTDQLSWVVMVVATGMALLLSFLGFLGFQRRDIET